MKITNKTTGIIFSVFTLIALLVAGCNTSTGPNLGEEGPREALVLLDGGLYVLDTSYTYPGAEVNLVDLLNSGETMYDISKYSKVTVDAILYSDEAGTSIVAIEPAESDNLAQFTLLKNTGDWDSAANRCAPTKYNMVVDGETSMSVPAGAGGVPKVLLLEANWEDFPEEVKSIKVRSITFYPKTNDVILDWGTGYTTLPFEGGTWPGKSVSLDDSEITRTGTLGDMSLYSEVIVDAVVYDRNGDLFTGEAITDGNPFFTLITNNSNWDASAVVKRYNMNRNGETSAMNGDPDTPVWTSSGKPTYIVFQGKYLSGESPSAMVGYVTIKKITFVAK